MFQYPLFLLFLALAFLNVSLCIPQSDSPGYTRSSYGSLNNDYLPKFLTNNPLPAGSPWGDTKPTESVPNTGVIRSYELNVSRATIAPDGVSKSSILINGQFPGPLIEANWGDILQVTVHNNIDSDAEGLTMHWHGQYQRQSPMYDGVPGVSQCPIAPGKSFTYRFVAEAYGTSWYHSHLSQQFGDGLFGPFIVYGPVQPEVEYDIDIGPIVLSDWSHESYLSWVKKTFQTPLVLPTLHNNFINGRTINQCDQNYTGQANCTMLSDDFAKFKLKKGKTHRLRIINSSAHSTQKFTIDGHNMTIIANDYVPLKPYDTEVVTLAAGQRSDVLLRIEDSDVDAFWMRSEIDAAPNCNGLAVYNAQSKAAMYIEDADTSQLPNTTATPWQSNDCVNDDLSLTTPYYPLQPPSTPATTVNLDIAIYVNGSGVPLIGIGGNHSFKADYNDPILLRDSKGETSYPDHSDWNSYDFGSNESIRIVLHNYFPGSHPMHIHGHDAWLISEGPGKYDGVSVMGDPNNPQRRDMLMMRAVAADGTPSHMVIEFKADNPGVWPYHCHLASHVSAGLMINIIERPDQLRTKVPEVPYVLRQTCEDWNAFSSKPGSVDEIDSGV